MLPHVSPVASPPIPVGVWDNWRVMGQDQGQDPWEEFDRLGPAVPDRVPGHPGGEPLGFGFRTGVRSARVAIGFAVYTLALGTILALTGCIFFAARGQWLLVGLMLGATWWMGRFTRGPVEAAWNWAYRAPRRRPVPA